MANALVETKFYRPGLRRSVVARPRLSGRLSLGSESRLTLISAPAGFGKTTLLSAWLAAEPHGDAAVAWLSLDGGDREPVTFWSYVITALQRAVPEVGAGVLPLLQTAQPPPIEALLGAVLNELAAAPTQVCLVLDDYHLADGPAIQSGMTFLLDHLPPQVHLVISSRVDPLLPLARLRGRGELVEVRAADLRFAADEAAAYLNDVGGLHLTAADIATLEGRTEGWIAALQLAALSLQGRTDVAEFIAGFAGDDRYIVDYLVEEVLQRQTEQVRTFLLRTCLVDRMNGALCDAMTGEPGGRAVLQSLDRANLFVVPLDDTRHWYRYHHLFADMLRTHLHDERPGEVSELHRRASRWYDAAGQPSAAVRHALAAGDVERAADLVEVAIPELRRNRQDATIRAWLDVIPYDIVRMRPVLAVGLIGGLMVGGEFNGVEQRLRDVERWLHTDTSDDVGPESTANGMVVLDRNEFARIPGAIEMYWAALALMAGDDAGTLRHAQLAIDRAAESDHVTRGGASALSGLALWGQGDLEAAHLAYSVCVEGLRRAGHISDILGCSITLADIRITQGRLGDAQRTYEQALELAARQSPTVLRGTADMYVGLSQIAYERGDLQSAAQHLQRSQDLGEHRGLGQNPYRWRVALARVREAEGDRVGALTLLSEAQRVYMGDFSPNVRPVPAVRARVLAAQGRWSEALDWAGEQGLSVDDDLSYVREFEHITLARVLLARYATTGGNQDGLNGTEQFLERLLSAAAVGGRTGTMIEILTLQALVRFHTGDIPGAVEPLEASLTLAEPEGYVRVFLNEGPPMTTLLAAVLTKRDGWDYARRLLTAHPEHDGNAAAATPLSTADPGQPGLVDPLSDRELDVLRLLVTDLDGPGIARRLFVSVNTLRTHTKSIYAKLGVNSRRAAVRRATELGILPRNN